MQNILLPSKMTFSDGEKENEQVLVIEPLHHGYGTTIGNALRRVMLASLKGAAVVSVKIKGAQHEFSTVDGVKEDVLDVILNLKGLRMKVHSEDVVALRLEVTGREGVVTAADIAANADVEIANPDLVIATLTDKKATLAMDILVSQGRGFVPTEERDDEQRDIGMIAIDSMFSPVISVGLKVENTRVGEITNYDKVIMNILTDGTMEVKDAVLESTKIIQNHFNWIEGQLSNASLTEKLESVKEQALAANHEEASEAEEKKDDSEEPSEKGEDE